MTKAGISVGATVVASIKGIAFSALMVCAPLMFAQTAEASEGQYLQASSSFPPPTGARTLCKTYSWACATSPKKRISSAQELALVQSVNKRVNRTTRSVTDESQYRKADIWALPTARGGDCEDFALLKKRDLIKMGLDPKKLLIATVLDTRRNSHAVLVYRSGQGDLVLDNLTNSIKPWKATHYLFLRMQDPNRPKNWVGVSNQS
ncbi:MAG: transglutaminase-like cysteine peptidase [Ruegeria sp.]|uniref:transglutaminase-like cysteine peptidase n=1 Tax=Ruegeria sp. TaxID=1879320 RepID=UPI00349E5A52